jgi:glycerol-3-phosphate acyltransferase PlsY
VGEFAVQLPLLLGVASLGYLLGSVPFGIVIAKAFGLGNLREIGSGNIGATNVLRTGSKPAALLTLLLDSGKGAIAVLVAWYTLGEMAAQAAGLGAFIGHVFPVWLRFRGGKGVATYLGILLALSFATGFAACMVWLLTAVVFRISSLAALAAAALTPVLAYSLGRGEIVVLCILLGAIIWVRHAGNIRRIINGTESKISLSKR